MSRWLFVTLAVLGWFNAISAVAGMLLLTLADGAGIPLEYLDGTPFPSYLIPGLILGIVVGGTQIAAVVALHRHSKPAPGAHAAAGLVMIIWIFCEVAMLPVWSPAQGLYFVTGVAQVVAAVLALGAWPGRGGVSR